MRKCHQLAGFFLQPGRRPDETAPVRRLEKMSTAPASRNSESDISCITVRDHIQLLIEIAPESTLQTDTTAKRSRFAAGRGP
jgi:hypothetical protein